MQNQKIQTLIVGATGQLGALITKHCLKQSNLGVNILVRNPDKNKELCEQVKAAGGNVIVGDMKQLDTLKDTTKGIHTVISALMGDDATVLEGQRALLKDAEQNGVQRFLPSDFACDYRKIKPEDHPMLAQRTSFREDLKKSNVKAIHIFNGMFMETYWYVAKVRQQPGQDLQLAVFDNADYKIDLTSYEDTARFVVEIVKNPEAFGDFEIVGQTVSYNEIAQIYSKLRGKPVTVPIMGTYDDLLKARDSCKQKGQYGQYIGLAYLPPMIDQRARLSNPNHQDYGIKTTSVEEFLIQRLEI